MKSVIFHGGLAVLGLFLAYRTWTTGDVAEKPESEVVLMSCSPDELKAVTVRSPSKTVKMDVIKFGTKPVSWFNVTAKAGPAVPKGHPQVGSAQGTSEQFSGNEAVAEYIKAVSPLRALRSLGAVKKDMLKTVGLEKPATQLEVVCGSKKKTLEVGEATFGSGDLYVKEPGKSTVYLAPSSIVRDVESASFKFMQRNLNGFELKDVDDIKVVVGNETKVIHHRNRKDAKTAEWVDKTNPTKRNELFGNWVDRLAQMRVQEYLPLNKEPGSELKTPPKVVKKVMSAEYVAEGDTLGKLEVAKAEGAETAYYAKSDLTRSWVKVVSSVAQQVEGDLQNVMSKTPATKTKAGGKTNANSKTSAP